MLRKIQKIGLLLATCFVASCGAMPAAPVTVTKVVTQTVTVPVYTKCVQGVPTAPALEFPKWSVAAGAGLKIKALADDWVALKKRDDVLEAAIAGCE